MAAVSKTRGIGCRGKPGPGRPKGLPNKVTRDLREMIRGALDAAGGQKYLQTQATKNPKAFLALIGRMIPQDVKASFDPTSSAITVRIVREASGAAAAEDD